MQIVAYSTQHVSLRVRLHCTPGLSLQPGDSIAPMHMNNMAKTKFVTRICVAYATNLAQLGQNMGRICAAYAMPVLHETAPKGCFQDVGAWVYGGYVCTSTTHPCGVTVAHHQVLEGIGWPDMCPAQLPICLPRICVKYASHILGKSIFFWTCIWT